LDSSLHGFAIKLNSNRRLTEAGHYRHGRRSGPYWLGSPVFKAGLLRQEDADFFLSLENEEDVFLLSGDFDQNGLLRGQGTLMRPTKMVFKDLMLTLEAEESEELSHFASKRAKPRWFERGFTFGDNMKSLHDQRLAQEAWILCARYDQITPDNTVILPELIEEEVKSGQNVTHHFLHDDDDDDECKQLHILGTAPLGSLRERYLPCYPGSGSKWLLTALAATTGLPTRGCVDPFDYDKNTAFLIKTHHQNPSKWQSAMSVLSKYKSKRWTRGLESMDYRRGY